MLLSQKLTWNYLGVFRFDDEQEWEGEFVSEDLDSQWDF